MQDNNQKVIYEKHPHRLTGRRVIAGKVVCETCGLVKLNNRLTDEAVKLGCDYKYHPSWKSLVKNCTKFFKD